MVVGFTLILAPVAPVDHLTVPLQPVAVMVALSPKQIEVPVAVNTGGVAGLTFIVTVLEDPLAQVDGVALQMAV